MTKDRGGDILDVPPVVHTDEGQQVVQLLNERHALLSAALGRSAQPKSDRKGCNGNTYDDGLTAGAARFLTSSPSKRTSTPANTPTERTPGSSPPAPPANTPSGETPDPSLPAPPVGTPPTNEDVLAAVRYRLAITDLFIEKAQYHLDDRAKKYDKHGKLQYWISALLLFIGVGMALSRMLNLGEDPSKRTVDSLSWINLLHGFILSFTAYGLIILTAVVLSRMAHACFDQRERLLAKRHSLRQGRLFLHLAGGNVTIEEMERAFDWNHEQFNAFTFASTDAKGPWASLLGEIIKTIPDLVKTGLSSAQETKKKEKPATKGLTGDSD